ncbi:MAG: ABC transporter ATP-binding protein [Lachnospiraceae bacterium]|nr:ABC transporter ATP-binding protein [Lachnospiraceae bacterium]
MELLKVDHLSKNYEKFSLKEVSFKLEKGYIMGFIGSNGAGKTTTLKSIVNMIHTDGGSIEVCGKDFKKNEFECKQEIGVVLGGIDYYPRKKLKVITSVVKKFYREWDETLYQEYIKRFDLDEEKKVNELSAGMKVKYSLALALSHNSKLLILDEPTSGLDPVSRDNLIELFQELIESGERSILFSTHITSDLEKCADFITYIKKGEILKSDEKEAFLNSYLVVGGKSEQLTEELKRKLIGYKKNSFGFTGLLLSQDISLADELEQAPADLETIMIYHEKEK